jgi:hypothetical protein
MELGFLSFHQQRVDNFLYHHHVLEATWHGTVKGAALNVGSIGTENHFDATNWLLRAFTLAANKRGTRNRKQSDTVYHTRIRHRYYISIRWWTGQHTGLASLTV